MPIEHDFPVTGLSQDEFHAIDRVVMHHAFDIQNELGRFYDEEIYHNELAFRLKEQGLSVVSEGMIKVRHQDFTKHYYLDVLVGPGALYELKAVDALAGVHEKKLLHYLFLLGLHHGKLINFSSSSVTSRFVSTQMTNANRRHFRLVDPLFERIGSDDKLIFEILQALLADWGVCLDISLYEDALVHFLGGAEKRIRPLDISFGGRFIGSQQACLLKEDASLHVSAISKNSTGYQKYLERLFCHTCLKRILWVNFNRNEVELITLKK